MPTPHAANGSDDRNASAASASAHKHECMAAALALARRADDMLCMAEGAGGIDGVHLARAMMLGAIDQLEELVRSPSRT